MALHQTAAGSALVFLVVVAVTVLVFYFILRWIRRSLTKLGLTPAEVSIIIWATLLGSLINIPLMPFGDGAIGVNVGGGVVPVLLSFYLIKKKRLPLPELFVGIIIVTGITYLVTDYVPGVGVISEFPFWLLPALGAFIVSAAAYWHERDDAASLAYVVGTLGVLIGADILRLPEILAGPAPEGGILAIGGGAVFDMVYLTGILAITMETGILAKRRHDLAREGTNAIDAEYEAWLRKKEAEWADTRRERERARAERPTVYRTAGRAQPPRRGEDWTVARQR